MHSTVQGDVFPFEVKAAGARTSARSYPPAAGRSASGVTLVLAHGAGAPQTHPWMVSMARTLAERGIAVVTFNFLYTEAKRRAPDRNDVLEATWLAAVEAVRPRAAGGRLFIGGKSMGGRIATQVAARPDADADGLVLLGYPLHPPGKPAQLRTAHLPRVRAPMLFVQGSRDAFGTREEMEPVVAGLSRGTRLFVVEGGDHSLVVPKSAGISLADTMARVADEIARFTAR
jgi:predicted alpha/beta-hydrolase family hydrolase